MTITRSAGTGTKPLPTHIDLRPLFPPVHDQGERGTCVAFAVTAAHEIFRAANTSSIEDLSEEILYWGCKQIDGDLEPGTSFSSAMMALRKWGQPAEALWPYDKSRDDTTTSYIAATQAIDPRACYKAQLREINSTILEIRRQLAEGYPVILRIRMSSTLFYPISGRIALPSPDEIVDEGHAVLVVGYDERYIPNEGTLIIRNSWGHDWGDDGYGYLPYVYIDQYGGEAWIIESSL